MDRACPCLYTVPCHDRCTCVTPLSSSGCRRCCTYGSTEQRAAMAVTLAAFIDRGWERRSEAKPTESERVLAATARSGFRRDELAIDHAHLQRLYKESRDYVATLERERDDLVVANKRRVVETNWLDARVEQLEKTLVKACADIEGATWSSTADGRRVLDVLADLKEVLAWKEPRP